jgi:hypothetical protein
VSTTLDAPTATARDIASSWLEAFGAALERADTAAATSLFQPEGWWRDLLAFTWDLRTFHGTDRIGAALQETVGRTAPAGFALEEGREPERDADSQIVTAFFRFETSVARARGIVRLMPADGDTWKAFTVLTAMDELKGHERRAGHDRPQGTSHGENRGKQNWLDQRHEQREFEHDNPQVLVIGAGQAGLSLSARLGQLGVETLVVEKNERIGDSWRKRYHSLVLHDPVWYDHLPYLPFPSHWPVFSPKDKLANWFEAYAEAMELNVWTGTELLDGRYDEQDQQWTVTLCRPDGTQRTLRPNHVVLATGMSGVPYIPELSGADDFDGTLVHSSRHSGSDEFAGRKALVVGCCNSGHDIAQEFYEHGADVTMLQRSSTYVMSSENGIAVLFAGLYEEDGPPTEDADLIFASIPYPWLAELHKGAT